jgi:BolA protein
MRIADTMRAKLAAGLGPAEIVIVDESDRHRGHAGHDGRGESHFRVTVVAAAFAGRSRLERQRMVYSILAEELAGRVHALALTARTPEEAAAATTRPAGHTP